MSIGLGSGRLLLKVSCLFICEVNIIQQHRCNTWPCFLVSGKPLNLQRDGSKLLKDYHFQNMDSLNYSQKMHGGGSNLQPLEGHVSLTKEPCCVTYDDDPREWRAKLACGHSVGQWSFRSSFLNVYLFITFIICLCGYSLLIFSYIQVTD